MRRKIAIAIGGLAVAVGVGVAAAGPASAASYFSTQFQCLAAAQSAHAATGLNYYCYPTVGSEPGAWVLGTINSNG